MIKAITSISIVILMASCATDRREPVVINNNVYDCNTNRENYNPAYYYNYSAKNCVDRSSHLGLNVLGIKIFSINTQ